jgi:hypothetical protein
LPNCQKAGIMIYKEEMIKREIWSGQSAGLGCEPA